jgi:hypothetical protein
MMPRRRAFTAIGKPIARPASCMRPLEAVDRVPTKFSREPSGAPFSAGLFSGCRYKRPRRVSWGQVSQAGVCALPVEGNARKTLASTFDTCARSPPGILSARRVRGHGRSPFLPNHSFVATVARKGMGKSHLPSACRAVGALVSRRRDKNASSGLVGTFREPGVGITQASH